MSDQLTLQDRRDLEDALLDYLTAVDGLTDLDAMVAVFTEDAVLDLSGLDLGVFEGAGAIREFYAQVFETMSHHMHTLTNFRVTEYAGDTARCYAYICGMGRSHKGVNIQVYVYYDLKMRRTSNGWKIAHFYEAPKLPMPDSVGQVHNDK
ncbi:nuclear transport factor 2 family protein [Aestuariicella hydrocarbonica]|uniref:Nuclear transport factor 2 family protein n=1 Tax=Pseudomaricurvus hydrocarbonicus TaxID=1470433 RepID=A0A9E5MGB3_9GAMM|nr:nuclear transport factor 2 family protein [Aestuariicella hydrocarbonica]NHO64446.1 nuclear transport factor 2 family protein [Aestuariicella hydrocarbonica]